MGYEAQSRKVKISKEREIKIPEEFCEELSLIDEVQISKVNGALIITPIMDLFSAEYKALVLEQLTKAGFTGQKLTDKFNDLRAQVKDKDSFTLFLNIKSDLNK
ncbi:hypothetical protein JFL43_09350 [Viridibacillus sp. YIM B01967]|uniref:SpoVT-AbrB domain-containing protein n=1 Tax=Viridibacillus soli TaxID=2798301 RepID=A0ABS1H6N1_9BACL|nr:hypothetical protein [Viridibacillus soli]MBK3495061.1 hypothetical protein [Viridibacillus soli]